MKNRHQQLLDDYWATIARAQDYTALDGFYLADSVLIDPIYGPFEGIEKIRGFLHEVTVAMRDAGITFNVVETAADGDIGWSRWSIRMPDGSEKDGVSVYRFRDGRIAYQHDYIGAREL